MPTIEELQRRADRLLGTAVSPGEAVTQALVEDDPGRPFSPFIPAASSTAAAAGRTTSCSRAGPPTACASGWPPS